MDDMPTRHGHRLWHCGTIAVLEKSLERQSSSLGLRERLAAAASKFLIQKLVIASIRCSISSQSKEVTSLR